MQFAIIIRATSLCLNQSGIDGASWSTIFRFTELGVWGTFICVFMLLAGFNYTITAFLCMCVPCVYHVCTMCVPCVYHACTMRVPCVYHVCTMCVPCVYHVCTMCVPCHVLSFHILLYNNPFYRKCNPLQDFIYLLRV